MNVAIEVLGNVFPAPVQESWLRREGHGLGCHRHCLRPQKGIRGGEDTEIRKLLTYILIESRERFGLQIQISATHKTKKTCMVLHGDVMCVILFFQLIPSQILLNSAQPRYINCHTYLSLPQQQHLLLFLINQLITPLMWSDVATLIHTGTMKAHA